MEEDWDRDWLSGLGKTTVITQTANHKPAKVGPVPVGDCSVEDPSSRMHALMYMYQASKMDADLRSAATSPG